MPHRRQDRHEPKKVVYLWGAGATQAEIDYQGSAINLTMMDDDKLGIGVATRILEQLPSKWRSSFSTDLGTDIEKLISLLATSNVALYEDLANQLRKLYFQDICRSLATAKVLDNPSLAICLLELHHIKALGTHELLSGIITTNHDGLLQVAAQAVHGSINIGISFDSERLTSSNNGSALLLQLHGSFTWTFGLPLNVSPLRKTSGYDSSTVWIPPTILKESKHYPFNKLAGLAYELLSKDCDILRIVGSSLAQNDWNIVSMIFNAQRHRELKKQRPFRVELIVPFEVGQGITKSCSYLKNLTPINQLTEGDFGDYDSEEATTHDMKNPLFYWMKEKIQFHRRRGDLGSDPLPPRLADILGDAP